MKVALRRPVRPSSAVQGLHDQPDPRHPIPDGSVPLGQRLFDNVFLLLAAGLS